MPKPYYEEDGIKIYHGDSLDLLEEMESTHIVYADLPYAMPLSSWKGKAGLTAWSNYMNAAVFYGATLRHFKRLTDEQQGAVWHTTYWRWYPALAKASLDIEWDIESLLVWDMEKFGAGGTKGLRPQHEFVALFCQPAFSIKDRGVPDIWRHRFNKPHGEDAHPSARPVQMVRKMLEISGATSVLEPFMGSGPALQAAKGLGIPAVGIEMEERYCELAVKQLTQTMPGV